MRLALLAVVVCFSGFLAPAGASAADYASAGGELTLRVNGSEVQLVRDGAVVATDVPGADWVIQGADGVDDTLTVRNPDGGIVPAQVTFAGGGGGGVDALHVTGGRADTSAARFAGPDSGAVEATRGSDELVVGYAGLEPLVDTVPAMNLTVEYDGADDAITIDDGVSVGDGRLRVDTPTTEEFEFASKTNVTVNGNGG